MPAANHNPAESFPDSLVEKVNMTSSKADPDLRTAEGGGHQASLSTTLILSTYIPPAHLSL